MVGGARRWAIARSFDGTIAGSGPASRNVDGAAHAAVGADVERSEFRSWQRQVIDADQWRSAFGLAPLGNSAAEVGGC
jgi:hypothetical protein